MKRTRCLLMIFLFIIIMAAMGCAPTATGVKGAAAGPSSVAGARPVAAVVSSLTADLTAAGHPVSGSLAVADLVGPGEQVTGLGRFLAEKLSVSLFQSGSFDKVMERRQLRQVLESIRFEQSGYFDQQTVTQYGGLIGVENMVIGSVKTLGSVYDGRVKSVAVKRGALLAMADARLIKDEETQGLVADQRLGSLTVTVTPPVDGTVIVSGRRVPMKAGVALVTGLPYGSHPVIIQPQGYQQVCQSMMVKGPSAALGIELESRTWPVTFQVVPPDAVLVVDGRKIPLDDNGVARITSLAVGEHSYLARAAKYRTRTGSFNPVRRTVINVELDPADAFAALGATLYQKAKAVKQESGSFPVKVWTDRSSYRIGDRITFCVRARRDCYLNLVNVGADGEVRLIFPNRFTPDNYLPAGRTVQVPAPGAAFAFEVEGPVGRERVYALASNRPLNIFAADFKREAFHVMTRGNTRGIKVKAVVQRLDDARLSSAGLTSFEVRAR